MKPETVLKGLRLVKEGKVYELGRVLEPAMPTFGMRRFGIHTARSSGPGGTNQLRGNEELVVTELGQVGTQFDALPHIGIGEMLYNCVKTDEVATRNGFTKLGVEHVGGIVTRGLLLDVAAVKGVEMLEAGYEITVADLEAAVKRQGVTIGAGDAVLIHTGWGKLWMKDNAKYNSGQPGIGIPAGEWLAKLNPILVGTDNWGIEVRPHQNKDLTFPVHQVLITTYGIFLLENLDLEALARDKVPEFAFVVLPLKLKGGTGSTVAPIAMK
jgi:kynurenine formamidase